jgi:DNA-3-methyladenine glycosylase
MKPGQTRTRKILPQRFFDRPVCEVARDLLGTYLVRDIDGKKYAYLIVETEAYGGENDLASHARSGKTARNWPMYAKAGTIYVYFTYGMHWMLNISTGKRGEPSAVLLRGIAAPEKGEIRLDGPARLTKHLSIDKTLSGKPLGKSAGLWIEDRGVKVSPRDVQTTPRIGIAYAGAWAKKPWRYILRAVCDGERLTR